MWDISEQFHVQNFCKYLRGRLKMSVPGLTLGNRFPWYVTCLFKTHINFLQHFASDSQWMLCLFCYSGFGFPLSDSYCQGYGVHCSQNWHNTAIQHLSGYTLQTHVATFKVTGTLEPQTTQDNSQDRLQARKQKSKTLLFMSVATLKLIQLESYHLWRSGTNKVSLLQADSLARYLLQCA